MVHPKLTKKFSFGHTDTKSASQSQFARLLINSSKDLQDEIADVYFGAAYRYSFNGISHRFGDVMGKEASDGQIRDLLNMQEKVGVQISITLNDMNFHPEISANKSIRDGFIKFLKKHYDSGIRICTISDIHLMGTGALQEAFPEMHWKNTVNHMVRTTQEVIDFARIGYNTILVDRSINRNINELKQMKAIASQHGVRISLLAAESCMPFCPFKREHDLIQAACQSGFNPSTNKSLRNYWQIFGGISCGRWRSGRLRRKPDAHPDSSLMPRLATDIIAIDRETFDLYLDNTDVLKYSGRLPDDHGNARNGQFILSLQLGSSQFSFEGKDLSGEGTFAESFTEIYEKNLWPFHAWRLYQVYPTSIESASAYIKRHASNRERILAQSAWADPKAGALNKRLTTCRNQCYACHECERTFGYEDFDSLLEIPTQAGWMTQVDSPGFSAQRKPASPAIPRKPYRR